MAYEVEISTQVVSYRDEAGEWLDGDRRVIRDEGTEVEEYPDDPWDTPHGWAVELLESTDVTEPSSSPISTQAYPHEWLSGSYTDPYTGYDTETSARLTGDWNNFQRADVFRAVTGSN